MWIYLWKMASPWDVWVYKAKGHTINCSKLTDVMQPLPPSHSTLPTNFPVAFTDRVSLYILKYEYLLDLNMP